MNTNYLVLKAEKYTEERAIEHEKRIKRGEAISTAGTQSETRTIQIQ